MDRKIMVGVELDGVIECMDCVHDKEDDDVLDRAIQEKALISARAAYEQDLICSVCGRKLTDISILTEGELGE